MSRQLPLKKKVITIVFSLWLTQLLGCSQQNDSSNPAAQDTSDQATATIQFSGAIVDGYLQNATLCLDLNDNQTCESSTESTTQSDSSGHYTLSISPEVQNDSRFNHARIVGYDGEDLDTGLPFYQVYQTLIDTTEPDQHHVSLLSTLLAELMRLESTLELSEGQELIKNWLNLAGTDAANQRITFNRNPLTQVTDLRSALWLQLVAQLNGLNRAYELLSYALTTSQPQAISRLISQGLAETLIAVQRGEVTLAQPSDIWLSATFIDHLLANPTLVQLDREVLYRHLRIAALSHQYTPSIYQTLIDQPTQLRRLDRDNLQYHLQSYALHSYWLRNELQAALPYQYSNAELQQLALSRVNTEFDPENYYRVLNHIYLDPTLNNNISEVTRFARLAAGSHFNLVHLSNLLTPNDAIDAQIQDKIQQRLLLRAEGDPLTLSREGVIFTLKEAGFNLSELQLQDIRAQNAPDYLHFTLLNIAQQFPDLLPSTRQTLISEIIRRYLTAQGMQVTEAQLTQLQASDFINHPINLATLSLLDLAQNTAFPFDLANVALALAKVRNSDLDLTAEQIRELEALDLSLLPKQVVELHNLAAHPNLSTEIQKILLSVHASNTANEAGLTTLASQFTDTDLTVISGQINLFTLSSLMDLPSVLRNLILAQLAINQFTDEGMTLTTEEQSEIQQLDFSELTPDTLDTEQVAKISNRNGLTQKLESQQIIQAIESIGIQISETDKTTLETLNITPLNNDFSPANLLADLSLPTEVSNNLTSYLNRQSQNLNQLQLSLGLSDSKLNWSSGLNSYQLYLAGENSCDYLTGIGCTNFTAQTNLTWSELPITLNTLTQSLRPFLKLNNSSLSQVYSWIDTSNLTLDTVGGDVFHQRENFGVIYFQNTLWLMGGKNRDGNTDNQIWSSTDGFHWQVAGVAPFSTRHGFSLTYFNNAIWLIGGIDNNNNRLSDVWRSTDGLNWQAMEQADNAALPTIAYHQTLNVNNQLHVYFGEGGAGNSGAYVSADGITWTLKPFTNPPPDREMAQMSQGKIQEGPNKVWLFGGSADLIGGAHQYLNDLWSSEDGLSWTQVTPTGEALPATDHGQLVHFQDKLWLFGGYNSAGNNQGKSYHSTNGIEWQLVQPDNSHNALNRAAFATVEREERLYFIGGFRSGFWLNDTWSSSDGTTWYQHYSVDLN